MEIAIQSILALILILMMGSTSLLAANIAPDDARTIAKEAFIYGFPMVEGYKTLYKQALDKASSDFKAPINTLGHAANVTTPADTWVVTPNSDTPYSFLWMDLRADPLVITMPRIEEDRYYSAQLVDLLIHNFAYLGTRTFGNEGGNFLVAGPGWKGEKPEGIKAVLYSETQIAYALFRTQLFNIADLENVKKIQAGYKVQPLSKFLGRPAPATAPAIDWPKPTEGMTEGPALFDYLNFLLQFSPTHPSETALMSRFAKLNIGDGQRFDAENLSPEMKEAVANGIADAWQDFDVLVKRINAGEVTSGDAFGTRKFLKNNYLFRFTGAKLGLYGNSREEALYPTYFVDAENKPLDASQGQYTLRFEKGQLPPAGAFWSLTMYDGKTQLLVANPINRYLLNSTMLDTFAYGDDGSLTLYIQKDSPGPRKETNWLPAPNGLFYVIMRIYIPKAEVIDGRWKQPPLRSALVNQTFTD